MPIPSACIEITCAWSSSGWQGVNIWHGQTASSGAPTVTDSQVLVDRLQTFYNALASSIASGTTITVGSVVKAIGQTPVSYVGTTPRTVTCTHTGDTLPTQTTLTVRLRTPDATRRGRGHIFLGNFGEDQNIGGVPISGLATTINTAAAGLISSPFSTLPALGVLSRVGSGTPASPNPYFTALLTAVAGSGWTVLRSRRR